MPTRCAKHNPTPPLVPIWDISVGWGLVHHLGESLLRCLAGHSQSYCDSSPRIPGPAGRTNGIH